MLDDQRKIDITLGVAQGSIQGPHLWNAPYDSLLALDMLLKPPLFDYTDDWHLLLVAARGSVLCSLMMNVGGPISTRIRLITDVTQTAFF